MEATESITTTTEFWEHHAGVFKVTHYFFDCGELERGQAQTVFESRDELDLSLGPNSKALGQVRVPFKQDQAVGAKLSVYFLNNCYNLFF